MTTPTIARQPQYKYRAIAVAVPSVLILASFLMVNLATANIASRSQNLQDATLKNQTYQEAQSLNQFAVQHATSLEKMSLALPSESMMVGVIQDIESVVAKFDPAGIVKLSGQNPVRSGLDLVIPIGINLTLSPAQINPFITELQNLPYLTQLLTLDTQISDNNAQVNINMRLYVQEPFTGY